MTQMMNDRRAWIGFAVLLVLVALLGLRSRQTATTVLRAETATAGSAVRSTEDPHGLMEIARRDSMLTAARATRSNPFRRGRTVAPVAQTPQPENTPAPEKPTEPRLLTLLYDDVGPCAQITIGSDRSGWLHEGEEFQGWNVDEIGDMAVTVSRAGRRLVLK